MSWSLVIDLNSPGHQQLVEGIETYRQPYQLALYNIVNTSCNPWISRDPWISRSPDSWRLLDQSGSGKVQPSPLPSEPFGVSARGLSQPKFGQQNEDGASMPSDTLDVIMTLVSYFCSLPGLARKAPKHYKDIGKGSLSKSPIKGI